MSAPSPLLLDGWLAFNQAKWGVTPIRLRCTREAGCLPALNVVVYADAAGRIVLPPGNPYMGLEVLFTPTLSESRRHRQWLEVAEVLVEEMRRRGQTCALALPPEVIDARLWQWAGYRVGVRYTFFLDFPFRDTTPDSAVRQNLQKATRSGFRCERVETMAEVHACLAESERRQGFSYRLSVEDLTRASRLLGAEHLRAYRCYSPDGQTAAAQVALHRPGGRALLWLAGTRSAALTTCATQFLFRHVLADLEAAGATGCDYTGANIPTVALQKSKWGGRLVPYYTLEPPDFKGLARFVRNAWAFNRKGSETCLKGF